MRLMMIDLDGTLVDTKEINYRAYKEAIEPYGYNIDYKYYCDFCNGKHYMEFLPQITTYDEAILFEMHTRKKNLYSKYVNFGKVNHALVEIIKNRSEECKAVLVTTASRQNVNDILKEFGLIDLFDLILTYEDILKVKPDPEGYLIAMKKYNASVDECMIFEDSDVGIEAAEKTGVTIFVVRGFN